MVLPSTIAEGARRFADRTAYVAPTGWALSYADIDRISDEAAVGLAQRGVRTGDVVALALPPRPAYVPAYCPAAQLGAITAGGKDPPSAGGAAPGAARARPAHHPP